MIKAANSFSSEEPPASGATGTGTTPDGQTGDTTGAGARATGATGQPQTGEQRTGEAPQSRIEQAVKNARNEVHQQYEWARNIPEAARVDVPTGLELLSDMRRDPVAFANQLVRELMADGHRFDFGGTSDSAAAAATSDFSLPQGDLIGENGVRAYSTDAFGKIVTDLTKHILSQVDQRVKPALTFTEQEQNRREQYQQNQELVRRKDAVLADMRQQKHFTAENEPKILEIARAIPEETRRLLGPAGTIQRAYNLFVERVINPNSTLSAEEKVREDNRRKVNSSIGSQGTTNAQPGGKPQEIRGAAALASHMEKLSQTDLSGRF
jgi:hypothetical protein